ncbi:response regulator [Fibrella forsythiae]|uniref:Response regulator transcription factor n=1 Tax=Fibrella forsythiae TaxID=2817061 RepID=A0ABS3JSY6_9BACT|nr:response regulator transcription factor [Fibrella forsythiae]MBO0953111.1 response regulator transcription factor [Fibrella forsythiae]
MQSAKPTRLLLIDDHPVFNDGLKTLINNQSDMEVCGQVFAASDVLPAVQRLRPKLILLDVNLQGSNSIDLGRHVLTAYPDLSIILLTMYNEPRLLSDARQAGMQGYLLKDSTTETLMQAIRTVLAGGTCFDLGELKVQDGSFSDDFAKQQRLTFREIEIIRLVREGLSSEQIADKLYLSAQTVRKHRSNIYFKLNITKVAELIKFASQNGI